MSRAAERGQGEEPAAFRCADVIKEVDEKESGH